MPAIVALGAVIAALMALLLIYGAKALGKFIAQIFPKSIGFGAGPSFPLREVIESAIDTFTDEVLIVFGIFIRPVVNFILRPVLAIVSFVTSIQVFIITAASELAWIVTHGIPAALHSATSFARALVTTVQAYALALYHRATGYALTLYHRAQAYALTLYHRAEAYAAELVRKVQVYARTIVHAETIARVAAVATAKIYAHDLYNVAHSEITTATRTLENEIKAITSITLPDVSRAIAVGVQQAEDYANTATSAAIGVLTTDVVTPVAQSIDGLIDDVGKLAGVIGTDLPDLRALVDDIPLSVPLSIAGVTGLSLALSRVSIKYMERCGVPNCRNLSKIGRDLADLFEAVEGASLLGLIGYIVSDPQGAAHEADDVLSSVVSDLVDGARNLIGV